MSAEAIEDEARAPSAFWRGARVGLPVVVASAPFGLLFGALAVENGFSVFETMLMSATIYGGASQMVGIELFGQKVAPWLIVLSIFAVNFRHILYSAVVGRRISHWPLARQAFAFFFLVDPQYAEAETKGERGEEITFAWYMGMALPIYICWIADTWLGATFGNMIANPRALGLDFLLPIYFLGLVMGFRNRPLWLPIVIASAAASILAYKTIGSPWHVSVGAITGILLAAAMPGRANGGKRP
ncbi:AzlC family ABC transporter permease [Mesorhizobium sp. WSM2239]|uniref:AzlC family ABC transporter permease n=2 Tax=unclassified Mesorhizobium TaxID=325217 RepID=A0AAU8DE56_9HYPH